MKTTPLSIAALALLAPAAAAHEIFSEADYDANARQVVDRDYFPVLDHPEMSSAAAAEEFLGDDEPVIGVVLNGDARAYPVPVMGKHELANDTVGGVPVAVSW